MSLLFAFILEGTRRTKLGAGRITLTKIAFYHRLGPLYIDITERTCRYACKASYTNVMVEVNGSRFGVPCKSPNRTGLFAPRIYALKAGIRYERGLARLNYIYPRHSGLCL